MLRQTQNILWRAGALTAFVVGIIGIAVPVLPTVPFLILSAWAASKGWPSFERWLLEHRSYGPHIRRWRERGVVPREAKMLATVTMLGSVVVLILLDAPVWLKLGAPLFMAAVATWLWYRPES
jgi:uncharacterized protein